MGSRVHKVMLWGAQWWHLNWWVPWRGRDLEPDQGVRVCACVAGRAGVGNDLNFLLGAGASGSEFSTLAVAAKPAFKDLFLHFYWAFNASAPRLPT